MIFFHITDDLLLFVRLYDSQHESLLYIGHFLFSQKQSFRKIINKKILIDHNCSRFEIEKCLNDIASQRRISITSSITFIAHKAVPTHNQTHQYELIKASSYNLPLSQVLDSSLSGVSIIVQVLDINQTSDDYPLTTIEDFFRFILLNFSNENIERLNLFLRNNENRQEFDVCNRDNLRQESLFKLYLPMKTSVKEVIRLIAERIEYPQEQIILQKPST